MVSRHSFPDRTGAEGSGHLPPLPAGDPWRRRGMGSDSRNANVRLEAVALGPAAVGSGFRARLKMGCASIKVKFALTRAARIANAYGAAMKTAVMARHDSVCRRGHSVAGSGDCRKVGLIANSQANAARNSSAVLYRESACSAGGGKDFGLHLGSEGHLVRLGTDAKAFRLHDVVKTDRGRGKVWPLRLTVR